MSDRLVVISASDLTQLIEDTIARALAAQTPSDDRPLTPDEACEYLRIGRSKLCQLTARRELGSIGIGNHRRYLRRDLDAFLEQHRDPALRSLGDQPRRRAT